MLYKNIGTIVDALGSTKIESRVLYLTNGSDIAVIKCRSAGAWLASLETRLQLPFAYTGDTTKIWILSDPHTSTTGRRDNLISAIADIDNNVVVDKVIVLGDLVTTGTTTQFDLYLAAKITSDISFSEWHEVAGNHDDNPYESGDFTNFATKLGYSDFNYAFTIGNIRFVLVGELTGTTPGELTGNAVDFLETEVEDNQDKNIFVFTHHGVLDTTYSTDTADSGYWYIKPNADIQSILSNNRIEAWFHGHSHKDADDSLTLFSPLALYEQVGISEESETQPIPNPLSDIVPISEGISFCHCPSVNKSVYNTFKFGSRKFGKNISICTPLEINEYLQVEDDGVIVKRISDSSPGTIPSIYNEFKYGQSKYGGSNEYVESINIVAEYKRSFADSMSIAESLGKEIGLVLGDSVSFSDGDPVNLFTLGLSDSISIATSMIRDYTAGTDPKSEWKFLIKDSSGDTIASLTNAKKRWFVERLNQQREAGFLLDADDANCNATTLSLGVNELHIYYLGTLKWAGQLATARKIAKGNDIYWDVLAKDWVSLLGKRFIGVEAVREFTTTDAGTIAWTTIDETQSLTNGDFGITEGTIQASINRSVTYDRKNILELTRELSNMGKDGEASYGFDFEITPEKVFNVYYPYKGTIKNEVIFRYPGNCEDFEALVDSWGIVNQEWGLGRHWTGETAIISRADATSQTTYKRREAIKSYNDMSVLAFLQDMVYQDIQWLKDLSTVVKFTSRVDEKTGINDYDVGDGVVVVNDKFDIDEWLWVYERKIEIDDSDELKVTLTLGN